MNIKKMGLAKLIDLGGSKKAEIATLEAELKIINSKIMVAIKAGDADEGSLFRAAHVLQDSKTVAWKSIAERLASRQIIAANTKKGTKEFIKYSARKTN